MKRFLFTVSVICLLAVMPVSCHKHEEQQTQSTYTFTNTTDQRITFDVYRSQEDYNLNANRMEQYFIEPGAIQKVAFDVAKTYWIDWYSEDYSLNNWRSIYSSSDQASPSSKITIAAENDNYRIAANRQDTSRSILINGHGLSSRWAATISNSSSLNGTHTFFFRKDFSGEYTYINVSGTISITPFIYDIHNHSPLGSDEQGFNLYIMNVEPFGNIFIPEAVCNPGVYATPHTGRDTILMDLAQPGSYYSAAVVRQ